MTQVKCKFCPRKFQLFTTRKDGTKKLTGVGNLLLHLSEAHPQEYYAIKQELAREFGSGNPTTYIFENYQLYLDDSIVNEDPEEQYERFVPRPKTRLQKILARMRGD